MIPATRTAQRRLALLAGGSAASLLLVLLLVVTAIFGAVAMFSGDEEGSGATGPIAGRSCAGAGSASLNLVSLPADVAVSSLTAVTAPNAAVITQVAWAKGLGDNGAIVGLIAALAESGLQNYANDGTSTLRSAAHGRPLNEQERAVARESLNYPHDAVGNNLDSMGLFQQRPMTEWGTPAELMDPAISAGKFFDALVGNVPGWAAMNAWNAAQAVQGSPSSDGGIYRVQFEQAQAIVAGLKPLLAGDTSGDPQPTGAAATPTCAVVGGGVGAPVVYNGELTITAPSGVYTVKLPDGARGAFLQAVATKMGTQYVWGAAGPDVFDCSGLMSWGLAQAGVALGRLTADDFWQTLRRLAAGSEQPGDLVLFGSRYGTSGLAGHIGVVIDPARHLMMHTYSSGSPADISHYDTWDSRNGGPLGFVQAIAQNNAVVTAMVAADGPGVLQPTG